MRTINNLPQGTPKNPDSVNFPDGGILNETEANQGTPVVEEIIGDLLTNIYKLQRLTKVIPNGNQDNEANGFQLIEALKRLTNNLNDKEQVLSLNGTQFSVALNLTLLPEGYFIIAKSSENYNTDINYTFRGNGQGVENVSYNFASAGFKSGDEVLLIIKQGGVVAYNLSSIIDANAFNELYTSSVPFSYNDSKKLWYQIGQEVYNDDPNIFDLIPAISTLYNSSCFVKDCWIHLGNLFCLVFLPDSITYKICKFDTTNLNIAEDITVNAEAVFAIGTDFEPYIYTDGNRVFISNACGSISDDFTLSRFEFNNSLTELNLIQKKDLEASFIKNNNYIIVDEYLYMLVNNASVRFSLDVSLKDEGKQFQSLIGALFSLNKRAYNYTGLTSKLCNLAISF